MVVLFDWNTPYISVVGLLWRIGIVTPTSGQPKKLHQKRPCHCNS